MTVHSYDGKSWLTKLERIGVLSAQDPRVVFNNLGHLINADMIKEQYWRLDRNKAAGIDKVTKDAYGICLDENINGLVKRVKRGTYKPKPARITQIPKEDGSTRPLAISCLEDKLVQLAASKILSKIYDPLFLQCSYGFRAGRSCHDALRALSSSAFSNRKGAIVEVDIRKCFDTIPHEGIMKLLRNKISDKRFLRLIEVLITAPIREGNKGDIKNTCGCPQGSIISPILANIYLHHVIDLWFASIKQSHIRGHSELIRYADDMVFTFEVPEEAHRFFKVLPKRLAKYGLEVHTDKTQVLAAGHQCAKQAHSEGLRMPTFNFLGFTCYWGKARKGFWRLKYKSRKERFSAKLKGLRNFLRKNLNAQHPSSLLKTVVRVIRGWINYHNISDNSRMVSAFRQESMRILFKWFNRRGRRRPMSWARFNKIMRAINFPLGGKVISMFPTH